MDYKIRTFPKHHDKRGDLVVFLQDDAEVGQIYFVTFRNPRTIRGGHYHKDWREWFGIVSGKVRVTLKDINTGEIMQFCLDAADLRYKRIEIGPYVNHTFESLEPGSVILNYSNRKWNKEDTFKHYEPEIDKEDC